MCKAFGLPADGGGDEGELKEVLLVKELVRLSERGYGVAGEPAGMAMEDGIVNTVSGNNDTGRPAGAGSSGNTIDGRGARNAESRKTEGAHRAYKANLMSPGSCNSNLPTWKINGISARLLRVSNALLVSALMPSSTLFYINKIRHEFATYSVPKAGNAVNLLGSNKAGIVATH